jgi:hypothetical protein
MKHSINVGEKNNAEMTIAVDEIPKVDDSEQEISRAPTEQHQFLHPTDRGRAAFLFIMGAFMVEAVMWGMYESLKVLLPPFFSCLSDKQTGFPLTFGVFQSYYSQQPDFQNSKYITVTGTLATVSLCFV